MAPLKTMAPACRATLSGVMRQAWANNVQYMARTKWVCTMPLGRPVVPEEYMMLNTSSQVSCESGGSAAEASPRKRSNGTMPNDGASPTRTAVSICGSSWRM